MLCFASPLPLRPPPPIMLCCPIIALFLVLHVQYSTDFYELCSTSNSRIQALAKQLRNETEQRKQLEVILLSAHHYLFLFRPTYSSCTTSSPLFYVYLLLYPITRTQLFVILVRLLLSPTSSICMTSWVFYYCTMIPVYREWVNCTIARLHCQKLVEDMARQQKSLQKLAAYRAGTLGALDRHSVSQTGSMRSHGRGGLGSSGHSTLLVTSVADADESEQPLQLHAALDPTHEPLPAVAVTTTSSSSSSRAATPPETSALPDVDDEGVLCARVVRNLSY